MPNKMLIDATHPEETRVVVVRGNRVEEFDFETAQRKQLRGNIYLAKVTRVEPSLQAAFIEYGGNRHGFLAFSEIHPDYYQIPVADRQALIEADERAHREAEEETENRSNRRRPRHRNSRRRGNGDRVQSELVENAGTDPSQADQPHEHARRHACATTATLTTPAMIMQMPSTTTSIMTTNIMTMNTMTMSIMSIRTSMIMTTRTIMSTTHARMATTTMLTRAKRRPRNPSPTCRCRRRPRHLPRQPRSASAEAHEEHAHEEHGA